MVLATCTGAVAWRDSEPDPAIAPERPAALSVPAPLDADAVRAAGQEVSRSTARLALQKKPAHRAAADPTAEPARAQAPADEPEIVDHLFMTTALNVWTGPGEQHTLLDVLPAGTKVAVTGVVEGQWAEIVQDGESRWVNADYLAEEKPTPEPEPTVEATPEDTEVSGGLSDAPCPSGSSVENGLTPDAIAVHRAVCANFPEVTSYGGVREGDDGEHGDGRALDAMISDSSVGDQVAEWVRSHHQDLGVSEVIWAQRIWTVERSSEGWRWMEDRGSDTANHYDHVHVTVYGYNTE